MVDNPLKELPGCVAEHLLRIDLDLRLSSSLHLRDSFDWDLTNPDNSPEEFAASLISDFSAHNGMSDAEIEWLEKAVALEIRHSIDVQVLSQARRFKASLDMVKDSKGETG